MRKPLTRRTTRFGGSVAPGEERKEGALQIERGDDGTRRDLGAVGERGRRSRGRAIGGYPTTSSPRESRRPPSRAAARARSRASPSPPHRRARAPLPGASRWSALPARNGSAARPRGRGQDAARLLFSSGKCLRPAHRPASGAAQSSAGPRCGTGGPRRTNCAHGDRWRHPSARACKRLRAASALRHAGDRPRDPAEPARGRPERARGEDEGRRSRRGVPDRATGKSPPGSARSRRRRARRESRDETRASCSGRRALALRSSTTTVQSGARKRRRRRQSVRAGTDDRRVVRTATRQSVPRRFHREDDGRTQLMHANGTIP